MSSPPSDSYEGCGDQSRGPDDNYLPTDNYLALSLIELTAMQAVTAIEQVETSLAASATSLPTNPMEKALLAGRVAAVAEELRWIRDYVGKLVGRIEQAEQQPGQTPGRTAGDTGPRRLPRLSLRQHWKHSPDCVKRRPSDGPPGASGPSDPAS